MELIILQPPQRIRLGTSNSGLVYRHISGLDTVALNPARCYSRFAKRLVKSNVWTNKRVAEKQLDIFASQNEMYAAPSSLFHYRGLVKVRVILYWSTRY